MMCGAVLALAIAALAQAAPSDDLAGIRRLINAGKPAAALEQLQALGGEPGPQRLHLEGVAAYHADQPARAVEKLKAAAPRLPEDSVERREAEQILGLASFVVGRYQEAIPYLEATRRWAPDNLELAYALGQAYVQVQRPDPARRLFAELFRVPEASAAAHLVTAQMMVRLEVEDQAAAELVEALRKAPELPHANLLLGQIALFRGRLDEAAAFTQRELAINPGNAMAFSQLGDAYVRQARWSDAIAALQRSVWLNPYYSAPYILLGRAYTKTGQPAAAEGMLRRAIQYDPNNRAAHYLLAQLLQQLGRLDEAREEFERAERLKVPRG